MSKRSENRRDNLRKLIEDYDGPKELALKLGYKNASFLVQMAGPNPTREVTEKSARKFESLLQLEDGSLDWPPEKRKPEPGAATKLAAVAKQPHPANGNDASALDIMRLVGQVCEAENVALPPVQFGNVIEFVLAEKAAGVEMSPERIARLVALVSK